MARLFYAIVFVSLNFHCLYSISAVPSNDFLPLITSFQNPFEDSTFVSPDTLKFMPEKVSTVRTFKNDVVTSADAFLYTIFSPVRWKGQEWLKFGGVVAGVGAVSLADKKNQDFWLRENSNTWETIEQVGYYYGEPYTAIIISGGFYLTGLAAKNEWIRETGLILGTSFLTSATLRTMLKPLVGRARPYTGEGNYYFDPLAGNTAFHSFPSGHMAVATSVSFVLARRVDHPLAKAGFYTLAGTTFISRMYSNSHWLSDLIMGGAITWFSSETIIKRIEGRKKLKIADNKITWELNPYLGGVSLIGTIK